jgi:16S rRNA (cytidine1402-2'-O)-methyltransferase
MQGKLYLVPAPLDFGCDEDQQIKINEVLPEGTLRIAASLQNWICENAKSTRAVLNRIAQHVPLACTLQDMAIVELTREIHKKGDHAGVMLPSKATELLDKALLGFDVGLISEAGMPAIADPGSSIVRAAHAKGIEVVPLVGPASILLALAASGLNGQSFAFNGYLAQDSMARKQQIQAYEKLAKQTGQSQIFIETPYRNAALLNDLIATLEPNTRLACSLAMTLPSARTNSMVVRDWRSGLGPDIKSLFARKLPAIFSFST